MTPVRALLPLLMALLFVSSACGGATSASSTPVTSTLQKITVSFSSVSYAQIATPVAQETGVFAKNGLDANLVLGPNGIPGLLSGEIQVLTGSPEETILAAAGGADLEIVAVVVPFMQHEFMVRPEIKTMADLKGKGIGVSKRGTITDVVVRMAAPAWWTRPRSRPDDGRVGDQRQDRRRSGRGIGFGRAVHAT
jgi:ABC-type nitrate/sulfonate/bicarbonate transport system substrate-binding protein